MSTKMNYLLIAMLLWPATGCGVGAKSFAKTTWHQKCKWKAEEYFDDQQVIALCKAIEANDLEKMEQPSPPAQT